MNLSIAPLVAPPQPLFDAFFVGEKATKAAVVTAEHVEESARLKALYKEREASGWLVKHGITSQSKMGSDFGIGNQAAVWQFMNARTPLSLKAAVGFARALGCTVADFSPRLAAEAERAAEAVMAPKADDADELLAAWNALHGPGRIALMSTAKALLGQPQTDPRAMISLEAAELIRDYDRMIPAEKKAQARDVIKQALRDPSFIVLLDETPEPEKKPRARPKPRPTLDR